MAKPVYSVSLFSEDLVVGGVATYDVPDGVTVVVRDCEAIINPGTGSAATIILTIDGISVWTFGTPAQIGRRVHEEGRWVAPGPNVLELTLLSTDAGATASASINGYYLT